MRKKIIAGNWKLNKTIQESVELAQAIKTKAEHIKDVDVVVCPVFTALSEVNKIMQGTAIGLGAQDAYWQDAGAFTGEVSVPLLKDAGCGYVILGHSERRQFFHETNETVNQKVNAVLAHGLKAIVCVGESLEQREAGKTFDVIKEQVTLSLKNFSAEDFNKIIVAYEPVWAIGTGKTATPEQAQEVHAFIRDLIKTMLGDDVASTVRIQYGGSVKPENAKELMGQKDIDGALVGGASLKADPFLGIIEGCLN